MIEKRLISYRFIVPNIKILTLLKLDFNYFLRVQIIPVEGVNEKFIPCELLITDVKEKQILSHKFFNECIKSFECKDIEPVRNDYCFCAILLGFSSESEGILFIELTEIENKIIEELNVSQNRKDQLYKIIDNYLNEDFEEAINKICIFGEFIAKELAKKIKKKEFRF